MKTSSIEEVLENFRYVPQKLRLLIEGHTVVTVAFQGWSGLKNGALLTAAEEAGYELFITADQEISYQQTSWAAKWPCCRGRWRSMYGEPDCLEISDLPAR